MKTSSVYLNLLGSTKAAEETSIKAPLPSDAGQADSQVGLPSAVDMMKKPVPAEKGRKQINSQVGLPNAADMTKNNAATRRLYAVKIAMDLGAIGDSLRNAGQSISKGVGNVGEAIGDYRPLADDNIISNALMGAGAGGLIGAHGEKDEDGGRKHRIRKALLGMLTGAVVGGAVGPLSKTLSKNLINEKNKLPSFPGSKIIDSGVNAISNTAVDIVGNRATNRDLFNIIRGGLSKSMAPQ